LVLSIIGQSDLDIRISRSDIYKTLAVCDLALVASGTATLETAIMEVPMVIIYKISPLSYWIGKKIINVPYIGLVNLIAGKEVVPELVQNEVTPEIIEKEVIAILGDNPRRELIINDLKMVKHRLGSGGVSERTARIATEMIGNFSQ
jgi:lipid-A-disaccharide synthase